MLPKLFLVASIYVGTMSFHFRNIFQWESFHRQRHRHRCPTEILKIKQSDIANAFSGEEYWEKSGDKSDRRNYTENGCRLVLRVLRPILPQTRILSGRPHLPFLPLYICNCTTWGGNRKIGYFCEIHQFQIFSTSGCFAGSALFYFLYGRGDLFSTRLLQLNWRLEITISSQTFLWMKNIFLLSNWGWGEVVWIFCVGAGGTGETGGGGAGGGLRRFW